MGNKVTAVIEQMTIPTYLPPEAEEMPMYAETRNHQGTTGNPYPVRVTGHIQRKEITDVVYDVVRLENDYIRLIILPQLGGRIFEAYDKVNDYHFLYRQHVIKPALIGVFGPWISGGMEFNWPFHHRPSTFMPVDYTLQECVDGSAICWLSEHDPMDRTKGTVGIVLRPDTAYFETRVRLTNRTAFEHRFLFWENAAVKVHEKYRLVFPKDVTWCHHHYDRTHATFPIQKGIYGTELFDKDTDISYHGNTKQSNSYFAAPSSYDFFGGYDERLESGIMHIADHHVSPGKKMFTWGYGAHAENWEHALTDSDGVYCELMAGSYSDDQPDFTYIAPFETKRFSQYWYPVRKLGMADFANLDAAVSLDREKQEVRVNVTRELKNAVITVRTAEAVLLKKRFSLAPCKDKSFSAALPAGFVEVRIEDAEGRTILAYTEKKADAVHIPADNPGIPVPEALSTAQDLYIAGRHIDQYRDIAYKPDVYYRRALTLDPQHLPSIKALAEYALMHGRRKEAGELIRKGMEIENYYDQNPSDGTLFYLLGLLNFMSGDLDAAYAAFRKAAWSYNVISPALTLASSIAGLRNDAADMAYLADAALDKERMNPMAEVNLVMALFKSGRKQEAEEMLSLILDADPLNHTARYCMLIIKDEPRENFFVPGVVNSNAAETVLDVVYDIGKSCLKEEALKLLLALDAVGKGETMAYYVTSVLLYDQGDEKLAEVYRKKASEQPIVTKFPSRLSDIAVLKQITFRSDDGTAWYLMGCGFYAIGAYEEAYEDWQHAIKAKPDFYIPYRNIAMACYSHLNRRGEALSWMLQAVERKPNDPQLINETSYLMAMTGIPAAARVNFMEDQLPEETNDDLTLELAKAYNSAGMYDKAKTVLLGHVFTPGEGGEIAVNEAWLFSRYAMGRIALKAGDAKKALKYFREALKIPENLHAGLWVDQAELPYLYYQTLCLKELGFTKEADRILKKAVRLDRSLEFGLQPDAIYYEALTKRLAGEISEGDKIMRNAIISWETELKTPGAKPEAEWKRFFYLSFIPDPAAVKKANLYYYLGLGALYFGDKEKAGAYFRESLALYPDNDFCEIELQTLDENM